MPMSPKGKVYNVRGKEFRLFPISVLASELSKALGTERTTQTIRKWESKGILPYATFRTGNKRLYTMEQIKCICRVAKEENIRQGYSLSLTNFSIRVEEELRKINRKLLKSIESLEVKER